MPSLDLNLLVALDVLLDTQNVSLAARRMQLSASAMSRTLARLREATGDPLLVRAGRALVPTPRALELREGVALLVRDAAAVLRPARAIDPATLARTFTIRSGEGFVETFGPTLLARIAAEAPQVRLRFVAKQGRDSNPLREGVVELETGVVANSMGPELRAQLLFRDRFVGVVRAGHPLSKARVTASRFAAAQHVEVAQHVAARELDARPIDGGLASLGLERDIAVVVGGFSSALALVRGSDLIACVPERHTTPLRAGMHTFALPFASPAIAISLLWHPRLDADPAHRWLRQHVREACKAA